MPVFEFRTELPCSHAGLFDFLIRPENIVRVSNPNLGLTFVAPPKVLEHGTVLDFKIISFGQVHSMSHKIVEFQGPEKIVEQQTSGPMKAWKHHHLYEETGNGCVKLDTVEFETPGGLVGFFLTEAKVIDQLEDGFYFREEKLKELIEQGEIQ